MIGVVYWITRVRLTVDVHSSPRIFVGMNDRSYLLDNQSKVDSELYSLGQALNLRIL